MDYPDFWQLVKRLRVEHPPVFPVSVRTFKHLPNHGDASIVGKRNKRRILIRIAKDNESTMIHFLLHEWAHALTFHEQKEHGKKWGDAHRRLYEWSEL